MKQEYSEDAAYHFDLTQAQRTNVLEMPPERIIELND